MTKRGSDDREGLGYFMPEDSQLRLKQLCGHLNLLLQLARPRSLRSPRHEEPEVCAEDLAVCLEALSAQATEILDALSWPAARQAASDDPAPCEVVPVAALSAPEARDEEFAFGITLDQIDALDRLVQSISAHGDVFAAGQAAELADATLPHLGQAIYDAAADLRDILDDVQAQRLDPDARVDAGVREARAVYLVASANGKGGGIASRIPTARTLRARRLSLRSREVGGAGIVSVPCRQGSRR